jgi:hypothetical protein
MAATITITTGMTEFVTSTHAEALVDAASKNLAMITRMAHTLSVLLSEVFTVRWVSVLAANGLVADLSLTQEDITVSPPSWHACNFSQLRLMLRDALPTQL